MSVEQLRQQLRERGYLTHGIERWFALDPWSSRAFWQELALVALKGAALTAAFGALPPTAVMLVRNAPLSPLEVTGLFLAYAAGGFVAAFALIVATALALKVRPALPIDTPRALLAISLGAGTLLLAPLGLWWWRFDTPPAAPELAAGGLLSVLFFLVASLAVSAALLSFSIYEVRRIPAIHQKPRTVPLGITALILAVLLLVPAFAIREKDAPGAMVVTAPTARRVALIAVDGLTWEIFGSRPSLSELLPHASRATTIRGGSTAERWASLGTGVATEAHHVRSIEGIRFRGGAHVLQRVSRADLVLLRALPALGVVLREPLPPTVRRRDYVWEVVGGRGVPAAAVNWWATADGTAGALRTVGPESVFAAAAADPLRVDSLASARFLELLAGARVATVYLPALDVILNRVESDESARLTNSLLALEGIEAVVRSARDRGFDVVLAGMPGDGQSGAAVIAATVPRPDEAPPTSWDVAPTILDLAGFPASDEMQGRSLARGALQSRIPSFGARNPTEAPPEMNREYYENLRSLGYIR